MNFANVEEWVIPEGDVKKVTDSQNRVIWHKDDYDIIDHVYVNVSNTGIIIPISLKGGLFYEIGMDFQNTGTPTSSSILDGTINLMGNKSAIGVRGQCYITGIYKDGNTFRFGYNTTSTASSYYSHGEVSNLNDRYKAIYRVGAYNGSTNNSAYGGLKIYDAADNLLQNYNNMDANLCYVSGTGKNMTFRDVNTYWGFGVYSDANGNVISSQNKFEGFIYECWVKIGDEYQYHFYPAIRNRYNQYGLYDVINDVFYPSCTENEFTHVTVPIQSMSLSDIEVAIGKSKKVPTSVVPVVSTPDLTWSSADTSIATVDSNGYVTGVSRGNTTITATDAITGISATCNVFSYVGTSGISLNPNKVYVNVGGSVTVVPTIYPSDAEYKTVNWWIQKNPTGSGSITLTKNSNQTATIKGVYPRTIDTITVRAQAYNGQTTDAIVWVMENSVDVTSVSLNKTSTSIGIGGTEQLTATVKPDDATSTTVVWTTSSSSVATVSSSGLVTGRAAGTVTITASCGGKTATCTVTVVTPPQLTGVSLDITSATLTSGDTITLTPTASPSTAGNVTYTWTSSNTNVATVNSSGKVTAVGNGTATITCTGHGYNSSTASATCSVTVATVEKYNYTIRCSNVSTATVTINGYGSGTGSYTANVVPETHLSFTISATGYETLSQEIITGYIDQEIPYSLTPIAVTDVTLDLNRLTLDIGETYTLTPTVSPSDALNKTLTWSSSNTSVAIVNSSGKITAKAVGTATITATSNNGISDACDVTVRQRQTTSLSPMSVTLNVGGTATLTATSSPSSTAVIVQTSNHSIATVSPSGPVAIPNTFTVTGVAPGTTTIMFNQSSGTLFVCDVTVLMSAKHLQIVNNDDNPIYYHTEDLGDHSLAAGSTTSVSLTQGDNLYIRTTDSISHTVDLDCNSVYTASSGYYKITFAKAEDGDSITVFR